MNTKVTATPPSVLWAQSNACVFLTFNVECDKPEIKIEKKSVSFKGICAPEQKLNEVEIPLFSEIDPEKSSQVNKGRLVEVVLVKVKTDEPFWPSLTSDKKKHHWLKVDFNRWQDEDDSKDEIDDMYDNDMFNMNKMDDFDEESSSSGEENIPDTE